MRPKIRCDRYCAKVFRPFWPSKRGLKSRGSNSTLHVRCRVAFLLICFLRGFRFDVCLHREATPCVVCSCARARSVWQLATPPPVDRLAALVVRREHGMAWADGHHGGRAGDFPMSMYRSRWDGNDSRAVAGRFFLPYPAHRSVAAASVSSV
jgi:hypothetical protein